MQGAFGSGDKVHCSKIGFSISTPEDPSMINTVYKSQLWSIMHLLK